MDGVHNKIGDWKVGIGIWLWCNGDIRPTQKCLLDTFMNVVSANLWRS
jgi:hypothetical protein